MIFQSHTTDRETETPRGFLASKWQSWHFNPHQFDSLCFFLSLRSTSKMKYILVTGGVISGIGKGIIASSVGTILKSCGLHVTSIKIDPYINIDAGTFSPYEHGKQNAFHF